VIETQRKAAGWTKFQTSFWYNRHRPITMMTLRADKQDIDAFAADKINFDKFAEKVSVIIY
jgi:hypothetical protein